LGSESLSYRRLISSPPLKQGISAMLRTHCTSVNE